MNIDCVCLDLTRPRMGICVSREVSYPGLPDHHQRHQHPQGVAGLKPEEIDHEPQHVTPNGVVTSLPFIEVGVRENKLQNVMKTYCDFRITWTMMMLKKMVSQLCLRGRIDQELSILFQTYR